ncbi:hypothetical protein [Rhizobium sp. SYY.PMSO]|uniref:hypothetical protein n=1 Tax=Rhizobium sp. SYY.PMSO TaxID=3382192 RepID=UPI00399034B5
MTKDTSSDIAEIARTVTDLVAPGMLPKDLIHAVREKHPGASKKEISRAAFYAVILAAEQKSERANRLYDFASVTRNDLDD